MRFKRYCLRHGPPKVTPGKLAYARRALQKSRDDYALFPELADQRTPEERVEDNERKGELWIKKMRDGQAATWRRARRRLRELRPLQRQGLLRWWQSTEVPGDACYLASAIHDAVAKKVCFWGRLAQLRRFKLIGAGKMEAPWKKKTDEYKPAHAQKISEGVPPHAGFALEQGQACTPEVLLGAAAPEAAGPVAETHADRVAKIPA